jgi:hypothetical protein
MPPRAKPKPEAKKLSAEVLTWPEQNRNTAPRRQSVALPAIPFEVVTK